MTEQHPQPRRSFLKWAIHGMGALFAAILGIPALLYLVDARNRPPRKTGMRPVDGIRLSDVKEGQPQQGVIRDVRTDAWTLHPNDVIGRVWVIRQGPGDKLLVFTTICPHLGCAINCNSNPTTGFTCPCHNAEYMADGAKVERSGYSNVAPRGMDKLEFKIDETNPDLLLVDYKNFIQGRHHPEEKA
jgi:menaquinol-cytochrome c reductase iron-sulfur subunit